MLKDSLQYLFIKGTVFISVGVLLSTAGRTTSINSTSIGFAAYTGLSIVNNPST